MPMDLSLQVLSYIKQARGWRQTLLQTQGQSFLLEAREDGHLYVGEIPQNWRASDDDSTAPADPPTTDLHDAGPVGEQATPILGVRTMDEDIIVWTESEVKVCRRRLWSLCIFGPALISSPGAVDPSTSGPEGSNHEDLTLH